MKSIRGEISTKFCLMIKTWAIFYVPMCFVFSLSLFYHFVIPQLDVLLYTCIQVREKYRSAGVASVDATNHSLVALEDRTVKCKALVTVGEHS